MSDTFKVIIPAQLEKSADGEWKVHGLASTNGIDKQGETIIQKELTYLQLMKVEEFLIGITITLQKISLVSLTGTSKQATDYM